MSERENFGTFGALMAMAGSAVGLGNLWRFPYLVGENGGAAFIILYIVCAVFIALPIFLSEFIIGRRSGANCFGAFKILAPGSPWNSVGILCMITPILLLSFYVVIGGWTLYYLVRSFGFSFTETQLTEIAEKYVGDAVHMGPAATNAVLTAIFSSLVHSVWKHLFFTFSFLALSLLVVSKGIKKGIEAFGKIAMPVLFFIILFIAIYVAFLPGASAGYAYLFEPDFSKITGKAILSAMGQAFFSLSLGCGCILTFASYVNKKDNAISQCVGTAGLDLLFALIAGCAIMPAVFSFGLSVKSGPSLVFETLPFIFSKVPGGGILAIIFFIALMTAALTSSVSLCEVIMSYFKEERHYPRRKSILIIFFCVALPSVLCALSFGLLADFKLLGSTIFELFDQVSSNVLMSVTSLLMVIFVGWRMSREDVMDEVTSNGRYGRSAKIFPAVWILIRYFAPVAIIVIMLYGFLL